MELSDFLASHEARLQRVEESSKDVSVKVAEYGIKIDQLGSTLKNSLDNIEGQTKVIAADIKPRLEKLESSEGRRQKRFRSAKKLFVPLLVAGAGAAGTRLWPVIIQWLTK